MNESLLAMVKTFDSGLPLERAHTIPSAWYFNPEMYAAECQHVFGGSWQVVARTDQVREPGSFVTAEVAGEPLLVVRDGEGVLRAFFNVCRHRAAQVINEAEGRLTRFRCRYHGWTYDLTGRLRGLPEFDGVEEFCREENGLRPLAVDCWGPLVFIHMGTGPVQPLGEFLAPLTEWTRDLGLERLQFVERRIYDLNCNWKVFVDNYQDGGYHVNTVHPGLATALDYSKYRTEILGNLTVQFSPMKPSDDPEVRKVRSGDMAYYWWIFPNLMLNFYSGVMDVNITLPLGPDRCRVIFEWYFPPFTSEIERQQALDSIAMSHQVQLEDIGICEEVQRGLRSRSFSTGRFSVKREAGGYHFHRLLARRLCEGLGIVK